MTELWSELANGKSRWILASSYTMKPLISPHKITSIVKDDANFEMHSTSLVVEMIFSFLLKY